MKLALTVLAGTLQLAAASAVESGFDHYYNLEYGKAISEFRRAIAENPSDPQRYNHLAQTLLYREMFKAGALESELVTGANAFLKRDRIIPPPDVDQLFQESIGRAMELAKAAIAADARDARSTYALAVAHGLRANWAFLVRKAYMDALKDLTASRKLSHRAVELDPEFIDARLIQGVHEYIVGSLPAYVRMLGFLAGFRGDKEGGIRTLREVAAKGRDNSVDAQILLGVVYRRERRAKDAIPLLESLMRRFPRNYLFPYELAQMWADLGDKPKALAAIDMVEDLERRGLGREGTLVPEKVHYARGNILFWYGDLDAAAESLGRAARNAQALDLHTGAMAWLRLGQTYDLRQDRSRARDAYQHAVTLAPNSDVAKESKRYLSSPYRRSRG